VLYRSERRIAKDRAIRTKQEGRLCANVDKRAKRTAEGRLVNIAMINQARGRLPNQRTAEGIRKTRFWPLTAQALGNRVGRIAPLLRSQRFVVDRRRSTTFGGSQSCRAPILDARVRHHNTRVALGSPNPS
jgi:hypothetical protein